MGPRLDGCVNQERDELLPPPRGHAFAEDELDDRVALARTLLGGYAAALPHARLVFGWAQLVCQIVNLNHLQPKKGGGEANELFEGPLLFLSVFITMK